MNDSTPQTATGGGPGEGGGHEDRDPRPKADPDLTKRFEDLDEALHGRTKPTRARQRNWSGVKETTLAFESIKDELDKAVPGNRHTLDRPQTSGSEPAGG